MMAEVPTADVVVTNPTHFSVALRYDAAKADAPEVVAKGQDLHRAAHPRARRASTACRSSPTRRWPARCTARSSSGHTIPEEFFGAVAEVLAFVYRTAGQEGSGMSQRA